MPNVIIFLDIGGVLHPDPPSPDQRLAQVLHDFPLVEALISSLWRERLLLEQLR